MGCRIHSQRPPEPNASSNTRKFGFPGRSGTAKMTFRKYRLYLYTALNRLMRSGQLGACVPFAFERCVLRKENCCFPSVSFWRTGRTTLLADVDVRLRLPVSGRKVWRMPRP